MRPTQSDDWPKRARVYIVLRAVRTVACLLISWTSRVSNMNVLFDSPPKMSISVSLSWMPEVGRALTNSTLLTSSWVHFYRAIGAP